MEPGESQGKPTVLGTVVCLPVRTLDTSLDFYRSVFDLPELSADDGIIAVELPGLSLFLIDEQVFDEYAGKAGRSAAYPGVGAGVILSCAIASREELDTMLVAADAHGGTVPTPAGDDDAMGLYLGYFFDPDGHHWELAHSGRS